VKRVVIRFLQKVTGYSRQQLTHLIQRYVKQGQLKPYQKTLNCFEHYYTSEDIRLLALLDNRHDIPDGFMVKKLCERASKHFGDQRYLRLSKISVVHIYNLLNPLLCKV
jgi:hypothetical protein